jgi:hypothetical protein
MTENRLKLKEENGKYHLVDEKRYSNLLKDDFANLPEDKTLSRVYLKYQPRIQIFKL